VSRTGAPRRRVSRRSWSGSPLVTAARPSAPSAYINELAIVLRKGNRSVRALAPSELSWPAVLDREIGLRLDDQDPPILLALPHRRGTPSLSRSTC
jgi:hypothetical protein